MVSPFSNTTLVDVAGNAGGPQWQVTTRNGGVRFCGMAIVYLLGHGNFTDNTRQIGPID